MQYDRTWGDDTTSKRLGWIQSQSVALTGVSSSWQATTSRLRWSRDSITMAIGFKSSVTLAEQQEWLELRVRLWKTPTFKSLHNSKSRKLQEENLIWHLDRWWDRRCSRRASLSSGGKLPCWCFSHGMVWSPDTFKKAWRDQSCQKISIQMSWEVGRCVLQVLFLVRAVEDGQASLLAA